MQKDNAKNIGWWEYIATLLVGGFLIFGILYRTGTLQSGYHFADDHELLRMEHSFVAEQKALGSMIHEWIINDLSWRFRPLYWVERVAGAALFGSEMLLWNLYTALKGVLAFWLLYFFARHLRYNRIVSILFSGIIMLGPQFTPWYRSANQENTGLLLCALTLFLIAIQYHHKKFHSPFYNALICISAISCGLMKESFTLFMPAFIALKFWLEYLSGECTCEGSAYGRKALFKCLKSNTITYGVILISFIVNIWFLLFKVGVDNVSYAGFQTQTSLKEYWSGIQTSLLYFLKWYTLVGIMIFFIIVMCYQVIEKKWIRQYSGFLVIGAYIMVVQLVAHAKSMMSERYIIPYIVGYAFVFVLLGYKIFEKDIFRRRIYVMILFLLLCLEAPEAYSKARAYAWDGQMIKQYFQCILDNTNEKEQVICAFTDDELNLASECWLETHDRTQTYTYVCAEGTFNNYVQIVGSAPEGYSWQTARVVVCYSEQVNQVLEKLEISDASQYQLNQFLNYCVIVRV